MNDVIPLGASFPPHLFDGEPHTIIYDPGRHIHNITQQLHPFSSMISVHHDVDHLIDQINNLHGTKQIFLALVFPDRNETDVRVFLMRNIPDQDRLHSLFLIFPNGLQFHDRWINTAAMSKLKWCRSFTIELIWDLLEVCRTACDQHISFYEQRRIQAEDNIERNNPITAKSITGLFAGKKKEFSLRLLHYLQMSNDRNM